MGWVNFSYLTDWNQVLSFCMVPPLTCQRLWGVLHHRLHLICILVLYCHREKRTNISVRNWIQCKFVFVWTGETEGKVQEVLQRAKATKLESVTHRAESKTTKPWHHSTGNLLNDQEPSARVSPLHHSTDHLHVNQHSTPKVLLWHGSTG